MNQSHWMTAAVGAALLPLTVMSEPIAVKPM